MKKLYNNPEIDIVSLLSNDILALSTDFGENETDPIRPGGPGRPGGGSGGGDNGGGNNETPLA